MAYQERYRKNTRRTSTNHWRKRCNNCIAQWWPKKSQIWERGPRRWDKGKGSADSCLERRYVGYLWDEGKNNGISIIKKNNNEADYPYISICGQHGYRSHKVRMVLTRNKGSTLYADRDTPNAIVTYNFCREHRLIVVDPNRPRQFWLDAINQEQLLSLNYT